MNKTFPNYHALAWSIASTIAVVCHRLGGLSKIHLGHDFEHICNHVGTRYYKTYAHIDAQRSHIDVVAFCRGTFQPHHSVLIMETMYKPGVLTLDCTMETL